MAVIALLVIAAIADILYSIICLVKGDMVIGITYFLCGIIFIVLAYFTKKNLYNIVRKLIDDESEGITQMLVTKLQANKEIGEIIANDCNIRFKKYRDMEFILSLGTTRSLNPFNKNKELYYEGRLFVDVKREVSIWSIDCEYIDDFVNRLYEMIIEEMESVEGVKWQEQK